MVDRVALIVSQLKDPRWYTERPPAPFALMKDAAAELTRLRAGNAELREAATAFEAGLSDYCDGPERDKLRAILAKHKPEP